jgi:hypothetical protein
MNATDLNLHQNRTESIHSPFPVHHAPEELIGSLAWDRFSVLQLETEMSQDPDGDAAKAWWGRARRSYLLELLRWLLAVVKLLRWLVMVELQQRRRLSSSVGRRAEEEDASEKRMTAASGDTGACLQPGRRRRSTSHPKPKPKSTSPRAFPAAHVFGWLLL